MTLFAALTVVLIIELMALWLKFKSELQGLFSIHKQRIYCTFGSLQIEYIL